MYGGGKGFDLFGMTASSIGESVERVLGGLAYLHLQDRIVFGSHRQLSAEGRRCLHPDELPLFAPEQHAAGDLLFEPWTEDTPLGWIKGHRLFSDEAVWIPAQLVLLFYPRVGDEPPIGLAPSGGLASHINRAEAVYHGICELFERDAVNVRWYSGLALDRIVIDRPLQNRQLRSLLDSAERAPGEVRLFHHNLDFAEFPVVTIKQFDPCFSRFGYFAGGGVGPDIEQALVSAFTEFAQAERSLRICQAAPHWEFASAFTRLFDIHADATPREFTNFIQVIPFYGHDGNRCRLDHYLNGGREIPLRAALTRRRLC